ncbi:hypothetical protein [Limosilactobacillus reuteri]|uniref:hypothetical protein n=1 Tax=Limosilactobacillus reuteri TaxID=1598 RepID=UPI001C5A7138|nr:hypothetical protein [Limosilactobacillus reuteri]MBW3351345.1 hypothetical protein [Limosilactobacillus reuteri]UUW69737.1 hypothetical protein NUJ10_11910 [Limosilactobacillus reuteri]
MNNERYTGKNLTIDVLPTDQVHQAQTLNNLLQAKTESCPLPSNPNTELIKRLHNQLPITNWAWTLTKQREYEEALKKEQQRIAQQSFNYKQPDDGPSL